MQYLGLALYAEGPNDYRFLSPLLLRLCEAVCTEAQERVDIGDVLALNHARVTTDAPRADRIAQAAVEAASAWNVLFVHADADSDVDAALRDREVPGLNLVQGVGLTRSEGVAVVPVRETEAWTLADGDALRTVFGTLLGDAELGLTASGKALERVADPKQMLAATFAAARPGRRRSRSGMGHLLNALGEQVALQRLRELPSFMRLELELREALLRLHILC